MPKIDTMRYIMPIWFYIGLLFFNMSSCSSSVNLSSSESFDGKPGDLLVVYEPKDWSEQQKEALEEILKTAIKPSLQAEFLFTIHLSPYLTFEKYQKKRRNILILMIDPLQKEPNLQSTEQRHDKSVKMQIKAASTEQLKTFLTEHKMQIYAQYQNIERKRLE